MTGLPFLPSALPSSTALTTRAEATVRPDEVPSGRSKVKVEVLWLTFSILESLKSRNSSLESAAGPGVLIVAFLRSAFCPSVE